MEQANSCGRSLTIRGIFSLMENKKMKILYMPPIPLRSHGIFVRCVSLNNNTRFGILSLFFVHVLLLGVSLSTLLINNFTGESNRDPLKGARGDPGNNGEPGISGLQGLAGAPGAPGLYTHSADSYLSNLY